MSLFGLFKSSSKNVTILPAGVEFDVAPGQSILEAALAQGYAMPHSCTVGTCGSCKCRLQEGKIREMSNFAYVLSADELQDGVILSCQARAKTDLSLFIPGFELKKLHPPQDFTAEIIACENVTADIKHVRLALDRAIEFDAGQYVQLSAPDVYGARAYSLACAAAPAGNTEIELFIRKVDGGEFTEKLFAGELAGTALSVHGPCGNFWLREARSPIVCVGRGSGLAPLLGMLEQAAKEQHGRPAVLIFGARTQADLYVLDRIQAIAESWDGAFQFAAVLSDEPADSDWNGERGYVEDIIASAAGRYLGAQTQMYICGSPNMVDRVSAIAASHGVLNSDIHADKFLDASHGVTRSD